MGSGRRSKVKTSQPGLKIKTGQFVLKVKSRRP